MPSLCVELVTCEVLQKRIFDHNKKKKIFYEILEHCKIFLVKGAKETVFAESELYMALCSSREDIQICRIIYWAYKKRHIMRKLKETYIDGDFEGWDGDKVYTLDDGSKWELASYTYSYTYSFRPKAILWQDKGRYLLQVQGVSDMQEVREIW